VKGLCLILEDQADTRAWLLGLMATRFPADAIAAAETLRAGRDWLAALPPGATGLALIDLGLPDGSGISLIGEMVAAAPGIMPVVTTVYDDDRHLFDAIAAGAQGYILKDQAPDQFLTYLDRIDRGEPPLSPSIARRILARFRPHTPAPNLTPRETEVLSLLGRGLRVAEAAGVLTLSEHTVADHVKAIYRKLNIASRAEAALEAQRRGLV